MLLQAISSPAPSPAADHVTVHDLQSTEPLERSVSGHPSEYASARVQKTVFFDDR
jgi:hypothetical protein